MSATYAQDVFFYGGKTYSHGDEIEPINANDRKSLEERGLIGSGRPEPLKGRTAAEERKSLGSSEQNKSNDAPAEENKGKAKS